MNNQELEKLRIRLWHAITLEMPESKIDNIKLRIQELEKEQCE